MCESEIQNFYTGQTIFLTGGTGFIGKLLIEKLLRSCPGVKKIYLLVRSKRGVDIKQRFDGIFDFACFDKVRSEVTNFEDKVQLIGGDCSEPGLGLTENDRNLLIKETTIIIHAAANVKFDQGLKKAVHINVRSVWDILNLAKQIPQIKAVVYISTAFSHCCLTKIEERFHDVPIQPENLCALVDSIEEKLLNDLTPFLLGKWPNTYVFTKAIAENLIKRQSHNLPITIVRPAIIISTYEEPISGWIDNFYGIVGLVIGIGLGVLRSLNIRPENRAPVVPADYVVNNIIAAAWDIGTRRPKKLDLEETDTIPIYNFIGSNENFVTWNDMINILTSFSWKYPTNHTLWYYSFTATPSKFWHKIRVFFLHTLVAYLIDSILFILGKRPIAIKKYNKINKLMDFLSYFSLKSWTWENDHVTILWEKLNEIDKKLFKFNMKDFCWNKYFENCILGGRVHLLKDPLYTIPKARRKIFLFGIAHYLVILFLLSVFYYLFKFIFF